MNIYDWSRVREMRVCDFTIYIEANPSTSNSVFNITEQQQQASFLIESGDRYVDHWTVART